MRANPYDGELCTHLPLISIDTNGQEIPGKGMKDENGRHSGFSSTPDGNDRITASMRIMDSESEYNHTSDESTVSSDVIIHVRGNSDRDFLKNQVIALSLLIRMGTIIRSHCSEWINTKTGCCTGLTLIKH